MNVYLGEKTLVTSHSAPLSFLYSVKPNRDQRTDDELLKAFYSTQDEAAFATLVHRHERTVWNVCKRVLVNTSDADDAFQATFIVLAKSGKLLADRGSIGGWLYRVAYRSAQKARAKVNKRRQKEQVAAKSDISQNTSQNNHSDLIPIISEELDRLPEDYRLAVIVCDLDGLSRAEAAHRLGWNEGTLSTRLHRGRKQLAERLKARGVTLSLVSLTAILGTTASASAQLLAKTIKLSPWNSSVSESVALLVSELTKEMTMRITTKVLSAFVIVAAIAGTGWLGIPSPLQPVAIAAPAPVPEKKDGKKILAGADLLQNRKVLRELNCTPEQRVKIEDYIDDQLEKMGSIDKTNIKFNAAGGAINPQQLQGKIQEELEKKIKEKKDTYLTEVSAYVEKVLNSEQITRLRQIDLQVSAANAFLQENNIQQLKITDTQKKSITDVIESSKKENEEKVVNLPAGGGRIVMTSSNLTTALPDVKKKVYQDCIEVLSSEQKQAWTKMIGEPVKFNPYAIVRPMEAMEGVSQLNVIQGMPLPQFIPAVAPPAKPDND